MAQDNKPPSSLQMHRALARVAGDSLKAGAGTPERENACRAALRAQQAMAAVVRAEAAESNKDMFLLVREDPFADMALLRVANSVFMKKDKTVEAGIVRNNAEMEFHMDSTFPARSHLVLVGNRALEYVQGLLHMDKISPAVLTADVVLTSYDISRKDQVAVLRAIDAAGPRLRFHIATRGKLDGVLLDDVIKTRTEEARAGTQARPLQALSR